MEYNNMWFEHGFDEAQQNSISMLQFLDASLACQKEAMRWAKVLIETFGLDAVELHDGMYQPDGDPNSGEGHTWLEVDGRIFDPTAGQFGCEMDATFYELHEATHGDDLVAKLADYGLHVAKTEPVTVSNL